VNTERPNLDTIVTCLGHRVSASEIGSIRRLRPRRPDGSGVLGFGRPPHFPGSPNRNSTEGGSRHRPTVTFAPRVVSCPAVVGDDSAKASRGQRRHRPITIGLCGETPGNVQYGSGPPTARRTLPLAGSVQATAPFGASSSGAGPYAFAVRRPAPSPSVPPAQTPRVFRLAAMVPGRFTARP
jgi:hypothetical protein